MKRILKNVSILAALLVATSSFAQTRNKTIELGNTMTSAGDMIFASGSDGYPARLAIGTTGQVLVVGSNGFPSWASSFASQVYTGTFSQDPSTGGQLIISRGLGNGVVIGDTALPANVISKTGTAPGLFLEGNGNTSDHFAIVANGANNAAASISGFKTRAASGGAASTIVNNGDNTLQINSYASDGSAYQPVGYIFFGVDGAPGAGVMNGALYFGTNDGGTAVRQRIKIDTNGDVNLNATYGGHLKIGKIGKKLWVAEGANGCMGTVTCNGTTAVTTSTTCVATNSRIFLTVNTPGGAPTAFAPYVNSRVNGTSFDIKCLAGDTSTVAYMIVEPA